MNFINRNWTPDSAEEWKKEDWIAIIFSSLAYMCLMIGTALSFLLIPSGFVILGVGIAASLIMYWVIDPKLKTISRKFEKKQKEYLQKLDEIQKWEADK